MMSRDEDAARARGGPLWVIATLMVLAALQLGRDVFIPMALAILLSVVLVPPARMLQRLGVPRGLAVALLLVLSLTVIAALLLLVLAQALHLAASLPGWEANLRDKLQGLSEGSGVMERAAATLRRLSEELRGSAGAETTVLRVAPVDGGATALAALFGVAGMLAGPAASLAVALLLMAYLLMQIDDVRDRFLRLAGMADLHRTTRAMADATERVGRYLLMQMLMNGLFGLGMGVGLALVGVPNAPLWGVLGVVLRFVPFLGAWIALLLPLVVAVATGEGWREPLLVLLVFALVDGVVTHVIEPRVYGRTVGVSPLALLISSAVWTVLWGPVGLLLAPPITACLAILGRHVPSLGFLEILLGDGEALPAPLRFYQRYLAGDAEGAQQIAEEHAEAAGAEATLRDLVVPAIEAVALDRAARTLSVQAARRIATELEALAAALAAEAEPPAEAEALRFLAVAGPADRALAAAAAAMARLRGRRAAAEGEAAALVVLCLTRPVAPMRLRRARAEARLAGAALAGLATEEAAAAQLAEALAPAPLLRGLEALAARLGPAPRPPAPPEATARAAAPAAA